ncbi:MAG: hypothetical protein HY787_10510 [Deltaproteobacteria bacterium]|nr:hypothetical protein [Deltaproteobacteria bacterium]
MLKTAAVFQLFIILLVVGFSTYQLFRGRFDLALGALPFLMVYYIFVTVRNRRKTPSKGENES